MCEDEGSVYAPILHLGRFGIILGKVMSEFDWRGKEFRVTRDKGNQGGAVQYGDFKITLRQLEILALKAKGFTSRSVAKSLGISHNTVANHMANLISANSEENCNRITTTELALQARNLELLYPISRLGLAAIIKNQR